MDQPLLLLKKTEDSKWIVTEDAEKQLHDMHKLIGVVSIAGMQDIFYLASKFIKIHIIKVNITTQYLSITDP